MPGGCCGIGWHDKPTSVGRRRSASATVDGRAVRVGDGRAGSPNAIEWTDMTDHDDARIDAALETLARPVAPASHVARVLARTSEASAVATSAVENRQPAPYLRPRWMLPVAATVLAVLGATWQSERQLRGTLDDLMALDAANHSSGANPAWGRPEEVVRPVLPPQAYWGMDPFAEFATLRPGTHVTTAGIPPVGQVEGSGLRRSLAARQMAADDELTDAQAPSALPAIELVSIVPRSLEVAPALPLETITLAEIAVPPIVIVPLVEEERP